MSTRFPPSSLLLLLLLGFSFLAASSEACGISVYWGQNEKEGSLMDACMSGHYKYIPIAFLTDFGSDSTPTLNLSGHCDPAPSGTCTDLSRDIEYCQSQGIKLLLSLGGNDGFYNLSSPEDARQVAAYLWDNYLKGTGGPLGKVALDGIDFYIEYPNAVSNLYWDELVRALAAYSTPERKVYLSAAPRCYIPDYFLDTAIKTGLFDYVWVRFYNSPPCEFGISGVFAAWEKWSELIGNYSAETKLFLGLPADEEAAAGGYINPSLARAMLGKMREKPNYGGMMLWNRYYDYLHVYSSKVNSPNEAVCPGGGEERFISQVV